MGAEEAVRRTVKDGGTEGEDKERETGVNWEEAGMKPNAALKDGAVRWREEWREEGRERVKGDVRRDGCGRYPISLLRPRGHCPQRAATK